MPGFIINNQGGSVDGGPRGNAEVARSHRWRITITTDLYSIQSALDPETQFYAHSCDRPACELDRIVMHNGPTEIYLPGKIKWTPITIKYYEVISEDSNKITDMLYNWHGEIHNYQTHSADLPKMQTKTVNITMVDGTDHDIWQYKLHGAWPVKVTPTTLDYSVSSVAETTVAMAYNAAEQIAGSEIK